MAALAPGAQRPMSARIFLSVTSNAAASSQTMIDEAEAPRLMRLEAGAGEREKPRLRHADAGGDKRRDLRRRNAQARFR